MRQDPVIEQEVIKERLQSIKRIVVKVGTNLLRGTEEGLNLQFMDSLAGQIGAARSRGVDVILVSSGAVGAGAYELDFDQPPSETNVRQALAAVGQSRLMHHYKQVFSGHGIKVAQVLLTRDSLDHRQRYLNARNAFETLLSWNVLPIVNENDTIAIEELKFGDNDQLAALIAGKIGADLLIILTDVQGIFDRPPSLPGAQRIPYLQLDQQATIEIGEGGASAFGLGGMRSKLEAARLATTAGILTFIGPGRTDGILLRILDGENVGTWCEPYRKRISARKRWLALGKRRGEGRIYIDPGAEKALRTGGKSLLPSGVSRVEGTFKEGDLIRVYGAPLKEIAVGLSQYSAEELQAVLGLKTPEVERLLGERQNLEVIHRDDMVVFDEGLDNG
jgi:glutamate 5-kinase